MNPVDLLLSRLQGVKQTHSDGQPQWQARCPAHDDRRASLGVSIGDDGRALLKCHAGCDTTAIVRAVGLELKDLFAHAEHAGNGKRPQGRQVAVYDYADEAGRVLFQTVRFDAPKDFRQRHSDNQGGWLWNLTGVRRVLYHLPEVLAAKAAKNTIWLVEGEKDADALCAVGLVATTNPMGANKWDPSYTETLAGANVVIIPDNDDPGRKHATAVGGLLLAAGCRVRVLHLPGLPEKGDVSDWLAAGGTREEFERLAGECPDWTPAPVQPVALPKTDWGNARRLVARHGQDLRFDHTRGVWLVWNGQRWRVDATAEVTRRAKETVANIYHEAAAAPEEERKALATHALRSESKAAITNMVALAASEPGVPVLPEQLDANPWLFNVQNGTLDLRTGELLPHRREDLITKIAPVGYDPNARHEKWDDFLAKTAVDDVVSRYRQKMAGYSLTGSTREEKAAVLVSEGGGGKTTLLEGLARMMGGYATIAEASTFLARQSGGGHSEDVAVLAGARLVVVTEVGHGRLAEELFKRLTGGDTMRASRKYERSFEFRPQFTLWMAANTAPKVDPHDTGVWRRLRQIPWAAIPAEERDPHVKEILTNPEIAGPAILAWAVEGCRLWQSEGLGDPEEIVRHTEQMREQNDPLSEFFGECCIVDAKSDNDAKPLRQAYEAWCAENGAKPCGSREWGEGLRTRGCMAKNIRPRGRLWTGIRLKAGDDPSDKEKSATCNGMQQANPSIPPHESRSEKNPNLGVAPCCTLHPGCDVVPQEEVRW